MSLSHTPRPVDNRARSGPSTGSRVVVVITPDTTTQAIHGTLRLRGLSPGERLRPGDDAEEGSDGRRIRWAEDVVDNEGLGRKKSKVCCIYHKPHAVGESSDESDSSSSSSDDSDSDSQHDDDGSARPIGGGGQEARRRRRRRRRPHDRHQHDGEHDGNDGLGSDSMAGAGCGKECESAGKRRRASKPGPNAYERMPKAGKAAKAVQPPL